MSERDATPLPAEVFQLLVEQSGDGIIVADENGVIRVFNPEAERQHGVARRQVAAPDWADTFGLYSLDGAKLALAETPLYRAVHGEVVRGARWAVKLPSGAMRTLSGTATPLRHADGRAAGALLITRDETERIDLERQRQTLAEVVEQSRDFIGIATPQGVPFYVNSAGRRLVGLDHEPLDALTVADFFGPAEYERVAHAMTSLDHSARTHFRHFRTGALIPVCWHVFPIRDEHGAVTAIATVTRDLTTEEALAVELAAQQRDVVAMLQRLLDERQQLERRIAELEGRA